MNISARILRCFVTVAHEANFTRAADRLNVSQSALSASIQQLEAVLGGRLLNRSTRQVTLTPVGEEFLGVAERLLADIEMSVEGVRDLIEKRRGIIHIGVLPSVAVDWLPAMIKRFQADYPGVQVTVRDDLNDRIVESVKRGVVDIAFAVSPEEDAEVRAEPVLEDCLVLVCPKGHELCEKETVFWRDLIGYRFISVARTSSTRHIVDETFARVGHALEGAMETNLVSTAGGMIGCGLGISVLPRMALKLISNADQLEVRPLLDPLVARQICILTRRRRMLSPAAEAFRSLVVTTKAP